MAYLAHQVRGPRGLSPGCDWLRWKFGAGDAVVFSNAQRVDPVLGLIVHFPTLPDPGDVVKPAYSVADMVDLQGFFSLVAACRMFLSLCSPSHFTDTALHSGNGWNMLNPAQVENPKYHNISATPYVISEQLFITWAAPQ